MARWDTNRTHTCAQSGGQHKGNSPVTHPKNLAKYQHFFSTIPQNVFEILEGLMLQNSLTEITPPYSMASSKHTMLTLFGKPLIHATKYPQQGGLILFQWSYPQAQTEQTHQTNPQQLTWFMVQVRKGLLLTPRALGNLSLQSNIKSQGQSLLPGL